MNAPSVEQPNENGQVPSVGTGDLLCSLDNRQLDHVSIGLEHNFGASLAGNQGEPETFFLVLESGKLVALHSRTLTVQDVWDTAKALSA